MAPTRAPEKSIFMTASMATIRRSAQQSRRQITDETEELENSAEANGVGRDMNATHEKNGSIAEHLRWPAGPPDGENGRRRMLDGIINYIPPYLHSYQWHSTPD